MYLNVAELLSAPVDFTETLVQFVHHHAILLGPPPSQTSGNWSAFPGDDREVGGSADHTVLQLPKRLILKIFFFTFLKSRQPIFFSKHQDSLMFLS